MSIEENLFKSLVSQLICEKHPVSVEREKQLMAFYNQEEFYYDIFCDSVYMLMTTNNINTISLDMYGYTRFDSVDDDNIIGYELLSKGDIVSAHDDLIVYVRLALDRLQNRLSTVKAYSK